MCFLFFYFFLARIIIYIIASLWCVRVCVSAHVRTNVRMWIFFLLCLLWRKRVFISFNVASIFPSSNSGRKLAITCSSFINRFNIISAVSEKVNISRMWNLCYIDQIGKIARTKYSPWPTIQSPDINGGPNFIYLSLLYYFVYIPAHMLHACQVLTWKPIILLNINYFTIQWNTIQTAYN